MHDDRLVDAPPSYLGSTKGAGGRSDRVPYLFYLISSRAVVFPLCPPIVMITDGRFFVRHGRAAAPSSAIGGARPARLLAPLGPATFFFPPAAAAALACHDRTSFHVAHSLFFFPNMPFLFVQTLKHGLVARKRKDGLISVPSDTPPSFWLCSLRDMALWAPASCTATGAARRSTRPRPSRYCVCSMVVVLKVVILKAKQHAAAAAHATEAHGDAPAAPAAHEEEAYYEPTTPAADHGKKGH